MLDKKDRKVTILVIDDDQVDVMAVRRALREGGIGDDLVVASDGMEGLEKLRDGVSVPKPYLVLLDINMPRMNGLEFLEEARKDPVTRDAVVFVLTTSKAHEDKERAYEHNIAGDIVLYGYAAEYLNTASLLEHYSRIVDLP